MFLIRQASQEGACNINYTEMDDFWRKEEKLDWLRHHPFKDIEFQPIKPDKNNNWINLAENDWECMLSVQDLILFKCNSIKTNRDEWVYDFDKVNIYNKVKFFIDKYIAQIDADKSFENDLDYSIKWSSGLKDKLSRKLEVLFDESFICQSNWRPFTKKFFYSDKSLNDRLTQNHFQIWGKGLDQVNKTISISGTSAMKPFQVFCSREISDYEFIEKNQVIPFHLFDDKGHINDNLTDWGLQQFVSHYDDSTITKEDIFHYVYAALHHPAYRKKYELNLKRDFPRIPFYNDFHRWAGWGKAMMTLHLDYETVEPFPLEEHRNEEKAEWRRLKELFLTAAEPEEMYAVHPKVKPKLRAHKEEGMIEIDELSFLTGVPPEAWEYRLGNRSALEWVLDQYKEKKPSDPTIAEKFNTYRFADYREKVIDLLKRVCTVSVETIRIIKEMER